MFKLSHFGSRIRVLGMIGGFILLVACEKIEKASSTSNSTSSSSLQFASGTKVVRINTSNASSGGSFSSSISSVPSMTTTIPTGYPGADGTSTYNPGVSAVSFYDLDGTTGMSKPDWLLDFQVGITGLTSNKCATFGSGFSVMDPINYYRVSEQDCSSTSTDGLIGTGSGSSQADKVFFRIILDRDTTKIGSSENLLVQVEYQASGIRLNSDGSSSNIENNLDQLWKIFWKNSLVSTSSPYPFGLFIPPNFSSCTNTATGIVGAPGNCPNGTPNTYRGSPVETRQFIIPLSAYPDMKVIQFSRVRSRANTAPVATSAGYIDAFCESAEPLCLGVVIRSVTLMRI